MRAVEITSRLPELKLDTEGLHKSWYRLKDRERTKTPIDESLVGRVSYCRRLIVRCGYHYEPHDYPGTVGQIEQAALAQINQHREHMGLPKMSEAEYLDIIYVTHKDDVAKYFAPLKSMLAWDWTLRMNQKDLRSNYNMRTFWYQDIPGVEHIKIDIDKIVWRWCGERHAGWMGTVYDDDYDAPHWLDRWVYQALYRVTPLIDHWSWPVYGQSTYYVHPLDLVMEE